MNRRIAVAVTVAGAAIAAALASLAVGPARPASELPGSGQPAAQAPPSLPRPAEPGAACIGERNPEPCYEQAITAATLERGPGAGVAYVDEAADRDENVALRCHEYKHIAGRAAFEATDGDLEAALAADDHRCQYGYRHGVMEAFAGEADREQVLELMQQVCEDGIEARGECLHAVGHTAAVHIPGDVVAAVHLCDVFEDNRDQQLCAGGTLMEYGNSWLARELDQPITAEHGPGTATIDQATTEQLCELLGERYAIECWLRIGMFWGPGYGADTGAFLQRCAEEPGQLALACSVSVGEWTYRLTASVGDTAADRAAKADAIVRHCGQAPTSEMYGECLYGVVLPLTQAELWSGRPGDELTDVCTEVDDPVAAARCREVVADAEGRYLRAVNQPTS